MPRATPVVEPQGESKVLHEVAAHDEQQLQERLKASPDLLPIEDFRALGSGSLSSATRREAAGGLGREDVWRTLGSSTYRASTDVSAWAISPRRCAVNSQ